MIYISLGSNLGNRLENIRNAVDILKRDIFTSIHCLPIIETEAILPSFAASEWNRPFLNSIIYGETSLAPEELLKILKNIETELGRPASHENWGPRVIDLDILLYNDLIISTSSLIIPHKELCNRPFLLHLLALSDPLLRYPKGKTFCELTRSIPNINGCFTKALTLSPQLVGIVNITPDSFSDGGQYFEPSNAIEKAIELANDGASFIELGAQSTRPGAVMIDENEELRRLVPVLDDLLQEMKEDTVKIILDSFYPQVIGKLLKSYPISGINDVKGDLDDGTLKNIADRGCKIIAMHSLSIPVKLGEYLNEDQSSIDEINSWIEKTVNRLLGLGFRKNSIVIDPGIGFGKSSYQSLSLIKSAKQIKKLGCPIMFGHSRKSYISAFSKSPSGMRDLETIAISDYLSQYEVNYLRVHNVKDHQRFFVSKQLLSV